MATVESRFTTAGVPETQGDFNKVAKGLSNISDAGAGLKSSLDFLKTSVVGVVSAMATWVFTKYIEGATLLAARVETLGVVLGVVGNNAGYTSSQMEMYSKQVQKMGITTQESDSSLVKMASSQMNLAKASQLARVAQDAAVIGQINSSQAFGRMIDGIRSGEVEILKNIGLNVNFQQSYEKLGAQLGKSAKDLTETEKVTARMNAVLEFGKNIAGTYEAAMGTASKTMSSMVRPAEEIKLSLGSAFSPALTDAVKDLYSSLNNVSDWLKENKQTIQDVGFWFKYSYFLAKTAVLELVQAFRIAEIAANQLGAGIAATLYLLSGGSLNGSNPFANTVKWFADNIAGLQKQLADTNAGIAKGWDNLANFGTPGRSAAQEQATIDASNKRKAQEAAAAAALKAKVEAEKAAKHAAQEEYRDLNQFLDAFRKKQEAIAEMNPLLTEYEKAVTKVNGAYDLWEQHSPRFVNAIELLRAKELEAIAVIEKHRIAEQKLTGQMAEDNERLNRDLDEQIAKSRELNALRQSTNSLFNANNTTAAGMIDMNAEGGFNSVVDETSNNLARQADAYQKVTDVIRDQIKAQEDLLNLGGLSANEQIARENKIAELKRQKTLADQDNTHKTTSITNQGFRSQLGVASFYFSNLAQLSDAFASTQDKNSRSGFETAKAFNLGAATMSMAAGIVNALTIQPVYLVPAAVTFAAITGVLQIAAIASTTFGGGGQASIPHTGAFGGGGAGAGAAMGVGSSIGGPIKYGVDATSSDSMIQLAKSAESASLAVGDLARSFEKATTTFDKGGAGEAVISRIVDAIGHGHSDSATALVQNDQMIKDLVNEIVRQNEALVIKAAAALGTTSTAAPGTVSLDNFSSHGDATKFAEFFNDLTGGMMDTFAMGVEGLAPFSKLGEHAADALDRLSSALYDTNIQFDKLGITLLEGLAGGNIASKLEEAFGSKDDFQSALDDYFGLFTDEQQKIMEAAAATRKVESVFAQLNITAPQTNAEFINLVNGLNLTTVSGQSVFATLMGVSEAFGIMTTQADELAQKALDKQKEYTDGLLDRSAAEDKQRIVDAQTAAMKIQTDALAEMNTTASTLASSLSMLSSARKAMVMDTPEGKIQHMADAMREINAVLDQARTGNFSQIATLGDALKTATGMKRDDFGSMVEYQRAFYQTRAAISELENLTSKAQTDAQKQVSLQQELIDITKKQQEQILKIYDDELNIFRGIAINTVPIAEARTLWAAAHADQQLTGAELDTQTEWLSKQYDSLGVINGTLAQILDKIAGASAGSGTSKVPEVSTSAYADTWSSSHLYQTGMYAGSAAQITGYDARTQEGKVTWTGGSQAGQTVSVPVSMLTNFGASATADGVYRLITENGHPWAIGANGSRYGAGDVSVQQMLDALGLKMRADGITASLTGFATGINYVPYDMPAYIHEGERIMPRADNSELMQRLSSGAADNKELEREVKGLRAELKSALFALAKTNDKMARILDQWDGDGMPEVRAA